MWKKTFIRSTLILVVALAGIFVFATTHSSKKPVSRECTQSDKECCKNKSKSQSDFIIWESLSRAISASSHF